MYYRGTTDIYMGEWTSVEVSVTERDNLHRRNKEQYCEILRSIYVNMGNGFQALVDKSVQDKVSKQ